MFELPVITSSDLRRVLLVGAHSDDLEIGCGGTVLKMLESNPGIDVHWVVLSSDDIRADEARTSASLFLKNANNAEVVVQAFRGSYFPYIGKEIKEYFDSLGARLTPDLIFTHSRDDRHQDHRLVCELTWNTFRNHLILEYEIPKYDGDLGKPNVYVPIEERFCNQKIETLMSSFRSQLDKHWFTEDTFRALMRLRGIECRSSSGYAEAFYSTKILLG
jgi:LmbE family N-acetylglucosaminyl deacetylase